jgi:hypothetical protein
VAQPLVAIAKATAVAMGRFMNSPVNIWICSRREYAGAAL